MQEVDKARGEAEQEVAELKHKLLQMTVLYNQAGSSERYRNLTMDQLHLVDQFVINLKSGRQEIPLNDKSKELQEEVNKLKAQLEFLETKNMENIENIV